MEWGERQDRIAVVALYRCGKKRKEIFNFAETIEYYNKIHLSCHQMVS